MAPLLKVLLVASNAAPALALTSKALAMSGVRVDAGWTPAALASR